MNTLRSRISTLSATLVVSVCLFSAFGHAQTLDEAREQYAQASKMIQAGDIKGAAPLVKNLKGYPLYPYLIYQGRLKQLGQLGQRDINAFKKRYSHTPLPNRLNRYWLKHLANKKDWKGYLAAYAANPIREDFYLCRNQVALLKTKQTKAAFAKAPQLWNIGKSQDDACDTLFKPWIAQKGVTSELASQRYWKLVENQNTKLLTYVERFVTDKNQKAQISQFKSIRKKPSQVVSLTTKQLSANAYAATVNFAYRQWLQQAPEEAAAAWIQQRPSVLAINPTIVSNLNVKFTRKLAANYTPNAATLLAQLDPQAQSDEVSLWRLRVALSEKDWPSIVRLYPQLSASAQSSDRWRYWYAQAEVELNKDYNPQKALTELAQERSFYGFLAAEQLGLPYKLNPGDYSITKETLKKVALLPPFIRARELFYHRQFISATREWRLGDQQLSPVEQLHAGYLADSWGWHHRAIISAASTKAWDAISIRFPKPYFELFEKHAKAESIPSFWPLAIARQESAFYPLARSHVGAHGLMQLMPATAKQTAKKHNIKYTSNQQLSQPNTNIALGTAYLKEMYERFDQNAIYATAAYNAGPHRVDRWLEDRGDLPLAIWIETIPFNETRKYVQNVMSYKVIYAKLTGQSTSLLNHQVPTSLISAAPTVAARQP